VYAPDSLDLQVQSGQFRLKNQWSEINLTQKIDGLGDFFGRLGLSLKPVAERQKDDQGAK